MHLRIILSDLTILGGILASLIILIILDEFWGRKSPKNEDFSRRLCGSINSQKLTVAPCAVGSPFLCINLALSNIGADMHYFCIIFGNFQPRHFIILKIFVQICIILATFWLRLASIRSTKSISENWLSTDAQTATFPSSYRYLLVITGVNHNIIIIAL